jgi:hypothetical protein
MSASVATTGQTSTVWFTLDGTDPRGAGGPRNPAAAAYTAPVSLSTVLTVRARAVNDSTGEWSPLTEAQFAPGAAVADSSNLAVVEIMYHPPEATAAETPAGFSNADDFEFIRLMNVSDAPVNLASVRFTLGVTFDFAGSPVRYLNPGEQVLVVKSKPAFQTRYGRSLDGLIAGEFAGNLSNSGERLALIGTNDIVIGDFAYNDKSPWPVEADGGGPSLLLRDPRRNPDPASAGNWMASSFPGGLPGGSPFPLTYDSWRALYWESSLPDWEARSAPGADPDLDGLSNFFEYTFGTDPKAASPRPQPGFFVDTAQEQTRMGVSIRMYTGAPSAVVRWQTSSDLETWSNGSFELLEVEPEWDGHAVYRYCETSPMSAQQQRYIRFAVEQK